MCRWITLLTTQPYGYSLADVVLTPSNSLIQVSKDASFHPGATEMNNHVMNGDGFGVGWYHPNIPVHSKDSEKEPETKRYAAVFRDTEPAWNNANLKELCLAVRSQCVVAHVRAASAFAGVINEQNCHPFKAGRLLFCHNGRIEDFPRIRRKIMNQCSDEAFLSIRGSTDSECLFALMLTYLSEDSSGCGSAFTQFTPFGHKRLSAAIKRVIRTVANEVAASGIDQFGYCTLNFCLTDGDTVVVTRYCDKSPQVPPPSLYFAFGEAGALEQELVTEEAQDANRMLHSHSSSVLSHSSGTEDTHSVTSDDSGSGPSSSTDNHFEVDHRVSLVNHQSQPGVLYTEVDPATATCIIASCPLTRTHRWHPMPQNSILWYTCGDLPEMRLLKKRNAKTHSVVFSKTDANFLMEQTTVVMG